MAYRRGKDLTPKMKKFAELVATGSDYASAYTKAYDTKSRKRIGTVNTNAWKLAQDPKIQKYIAELKKPVLEKLEITLEGQLNKLSEIYKKALEAEDWNSAIKAQQEENKLIGLYAPTKVDNRVQVTDYTIETNE
jgi:phage terminase small subunit